MFTRSNRSLLILTIVLGIFAVAMSLWAWSVSRFPGDLQVTLFLQSIDNGVLQSVMEWISFPFGGWQAAVTTVVIAGLVWWRAGKGAGIMVLSAGLLSTISYLLKWMINRPRPSSDLVQVFGIETGRGFPSGHAFFTILVIGTLVYFIMLNMRNKLLRILASVACVFLILLVGVSRVYLGVHWTSDVVGGYSFGIILLLWLLWSYRRLSVHTR